MPFSNVYDIKGDGVTQMPELKTVTIRESTLRDADFLFRLYAETRDAEVSAFGWSAAEAEAFLRMQYDMRRRAYEMRHRNAAFQIVESDGLPVGELIISHSSDHIFLIDIAVIQTLRGTGIGSEVIRRLQGEAVEMKRTIVLHVAQENAAARRLYEKHGFVTVSTASDATIEMRWAVS